MLTLQQLLRPSSEEESFRLLLDLAVSLGFPVTSWQPGGVARTLLRASARLHADCTQLITQVAAGGYLSTAGGAWLSLLARTLYGVERHPALFTRGVVELSAVAGAGPYTINPGDFWCATAAGKRFVNTTGGVLVPGGSLQLEVRSESPGVSYAVGVGTVTEMVTPLAGVSVTNPDLGAGSGWMLDVGSDEEADDSLRDRCGQRWSTLGGQPPGQAYEYWAKEASPQVQRVAVDDRNPSAPGRVHVYLASEAGGVPAPVVSTVEAHLLPRAAKTAELSVQSVSELSVLVSGVVYIRTAQFDAVIAAIVEGLDELFRSSPIGGEITAPSTQGWLYRAKILGTIAGVDGVVNAQLFAPAADVPVQRYQVATWVNSLTFQAV